MTGFMGMGMAMNAGGGMNAQNLYAMGQQQQAAQQPAPSPALAQKTVGNVPVELQRPENSVRSAALRSRRIRTDGPVPAER